MKADNCKDVRRAIERGEEDGLIRVHLDGCAECAEYAAREKMLEDGLKSLAAGEAPPLEKFLADPDQVHRRIPSVRNTIVRRAILVAAVLAIMVAASAFVPVSVTDTQAYQIILPQGQYDPGAIGGFEVTGNASQVECNVQMIFRGDTPEVTCTLATDDPGVVDEFVAQLADKLDISVTEVAVVPVTNTVQTTLFNLCRVTITGDDLAPGEKRDISDQVKRQMILDGQPVGDVQATMERSADGEEVRVEITHEIDE